MLDSSTTSMPLSASRNTSAVYTQQVIGDGEAAARRRSRLPGAFRGAGRGLTTLPCIARGSLWSGRPYHFRCAWMGIRLKTQYWFPQSSIIVSG
jgi:hypothetical protein